MKYMKTFLVVFAAWALTAARPDAGYNVGDLVSDFKLKNVDGKMVALSDYKSTKGLIVIFDCNTCPYSRAYNERIQQLNEQYGPKGFPVVAINSNDPESSPGDSFEEMISHAKDKGYSFPYLFDEKQQVAKSFGATNTPHVFVLKREGNDFKVAYTGAIDNSPRDASKADKKYVQDAVNALLSDKTITTTKTKAVGCGIKWKDA